MSMEITQAILIIWMMAVMIIKGKYQQYLFEIKDDVITVKRLMNNKIAYEKIIIKYKEKVFEIDGGLSKVKLIK